MGLSEEDKKWFEGKFEKFESRISKMEIKADKLMNLARSAADKFMN